MNDPEDTPTREDIIELVARNMYSGRIINNTHRGDVVEMIVLSALGEEWNLVGLGWHPWDLQRGSAETRVRIQVKQSAALQLWGPTKNPSLQFGWSKNVPNYFHRDNPGEEIESEGWFCDIFVFGIHLEHDPSIADQVDPKRWQFLVIPTTDLKRGQNSMVLGKALRRWSLVSWNELKDAVDEVM